MEDSAPASIVEADLDLPEHREATLRLLNAYSMDPMGDGRPLSEESKRNVIPGLRNHPTTIVFLAHVGPEPAGLAICFLGFSTFAARPLINLHDFFVLPAHRGAGLAPLLLGAIEQKARALGCCKVTLEVLENNHRARRVYATAGFAQGTYAPEAGGSLFLWKTL